MEKKVATFAGGCFWCIESAFVTFPGVLSVKSGFVGKSEKKPTYEETWDDNAGFVEAVQLVYDSDAVQYEELLEQFWRQIDPTDPDGQFADRGPQYRTGIYYHDADQKRLAQTSKKSLSDSRKFSRPIATAILPFEHFYEAEDYHQDYARKNPLRYKLYKVGSGRQGYLEKTWKD